MCPLSRTPPEIVLHIFQSCSDFAEILAFASTCKHVHSVWILNSQTVITKTLVATLSVQNFSDALLAVRATNIIRKAFLAESHINPLFPFSELIGCPEQPSLHELRLVLDFRYLVRCVEKLFLYGTRDRGGQLYHPSEVVAAGMFGSFDAEDWKRFKCNFHRAVYRVLLLGAVLYGAYNEPFAQAQAQKVQHHDEGFLRFQRAAYSPDEFGVKQFRHQMTSEEAQYLSGFPVYDLHFQGDGEDKENKFKDEACRVIFDPLAKWIIQDGKARGIQKAQEKVNDDSDSPEEDTEEGDAVESTYNPGVAGSIEEIMMIISALEQLTNKIANVDGTARYGLRYLPDQEVVNLKVSRKVVVIIYGEFALEEICMPTKSDDQGKALLVARSLQPPSNKPTQGKDSSSQDQNISQALINIPYVMNRLHHAAKTPNMQNDYPSPPPIYDFFIFTARKYLNLKFQPEFLAQHPYSGYIAQISWGGALVEIEEYPFMEYTPSTLSYQPL